MWPWGLAISIGVEGKHLFKHLSIIHRLTRKTGSHLACLPLTCIVLCHSFSYKKHRKVSMHLRVLTVC